MSDATGSHQDLHCEQGAIKGEHWAGPAIR